MNNYEMKVTPNIDEKGNTYWSVSYPQIDGCVGGGSTIEEAVAEAQENLEIYLDFLKEEGKTLPSPEKNTCSGKIALRISKHTHKEISEMADRCGVSINSFINCAIENYIGKKQFEEKMDEKISSMLESISINSDIQQINTVATMSLNKTLKASWDKYKLPVGSAINE